MIERCMIGWRAFALPAMLSCILLSALPAAAAPQIAWIFPPGGQRGATVTAELHGSGLASVSGLFCTSAGLKMTVLPSSPPPKGQADPADSMRQVRIEIAPNAPLGACEIRAYDQSAISNVKMFQVGEWPETREIEPNDHPDQANRVKIPVTINGQIERYSDQDCYKFAAAAGQQISCVVDSERLLSSFDDSWLKGSLEVIDPHGRSIAWNDGRYHWDALINFTAQETGDYLVRFHDLQWRGSPAAVYRLTIGPVPYALAAFPPGARQGSKVKLAFVGSNLGPDPTEIWSAPTGSDETVHEVRFHTARGDSNPVTIQMGSDPEYTEQEPNDDDAHANRVTLPVVINGILERPGDHDRFRFHVDAHQRLVMETFADRAGSPVDTYLTLRDSKGGTVQENDDARDRDSIIDRTFDSAGDYTVEVRDVDERGGPDFTYRLRIGPPPADFKLLASPDSVVVPGGGAARLDVKVEREWDYSGEVHVHVEGLAPGMTASTGTIPAGSDRTTVTLQGNGAAAPSVIRVVGSAVIGGHTVTHTARSEEQYNLQGTAYQRTVVGPVVMSGAAAPFMLAASPSTLELSASNPASIKVAVKRSKDVEGPVKLKVDGLPGGVTADPVEIPAGQDTGTLVLKAAEDTGAASAPVLITGTLHTADNKDVDALAPAIQVKVNEVPTFRIAGPDQASVGAGKTATITVSVTRRGGYSGAVALTVRGLPAGITVDPAKIEPGKNQTQVILHASKTVRPTGARPVEIFVDGSGTVQGILRTFATNSIKLVVAG